MSPIGHLFAPEARSKQRLDNAEEWHSALGTDLAEGDREGLDAPILLAVVNGRGTHDEDWRARRR